MAVVKVIEIISEGDSIEDAIKEAYKEAAKTLDNIKQIDVKHFSAIVDGKKIRFRVNAKISFVVSDKKR